MTHKPSLAIVTAGLLAAAVLFAPYGRTAAHERSATSTEFSAQVKKEEGKKAAPGSLIHTTATDVEKWTTKQWDAAKTEWAKDKKKWADCRKWAKEQKLDGRKSWSFLYTCMTS